MWPLLNLFLDIAMLRRGPQDVPTSPVLLQACLLPYIVLGLITLMAGAEQFALLPALALTMLDLVLITALVYGVLHVLGYTARVMQTLTALFGVGILLQLVALPLSLWLRRLAADGSDTAGLPHVLALLLLAWNVAVLGHILRNAFSTSFGVGISCALGYVLTFWVTGYWLIPQAAVAQ